MNLLLILGNQLFPKEKLEKVIKENKCNGIYMAEDKGLCTHFAYHKLKIAFFLSAMRHYKKAIENLPINITYHYFDAKDDLTFVKRLKIFIEEKSVKKLTCFEIEDKFMEEAISALCDEVGLELTFVASPMFLTSRAEFEDYLSSCKSPLMATFYQKQRRKHKILMEANKPMGGQFSFDKANRKKLPKSIELPNYIKGKIDEIDEEVIDLVENEFGDHIGCLEHNWFPTDRQSALKSLQRFAKERLRLFGPYQDAITTREGYLFHSHLSPMLNAGLLCPDEILDVVLKEFKGTDIPIESIEGFVRQILGWREFVRGIYQNYSKRLETTNYWGADRSLKKCWYEGTTGIPPLDDAILNAVNTGYGHHIERLMIVANMMNLCQVHPHSVNKWFMEMYADSSDWVMAPNVYGMGLMSDGGIFATKPYISGSNYILKMSDYKKGEWCDIWDGLYWRFIERHNNFFKSNPRLALMVGTLNKMDSERKKQIFEAADEFTTKVTETADICN